MKQWHFLGVFILSFFSSIAVASEEDASEHYFRGMHFLASYSGCDTEALGNVEQLKQEMLEAVQTCGATILDQTSYLFPPNGLTMVFFAFRKSRKHSHVSRAWSLFCRSFYLRGELFLCSI